MVAHEREECSFKRWAAVLRLLAAPAKMPSAWSRSATGSSLAPTMSKSPSMFCFSVSGDGLCKTPAAF